MQTIFDCGYLCKQLLKRMIQLLILVMLPPSTLSLIQQSMVNFPCLNVTVPYPCNLQVIYPYPIGRTTCDGQYRRGGYGSSAFDNHPTLKAAVTKQPLKALVVIYDREVEMYHALYLATVNKQCDVVPIEQSRYVPPTPPGGTHHYVFFLFDAGNLDLLDGSEDSLRMCVLVARLGLRDPIAVTQLRISNNDGQADAVPRTTGKPLMCPLSPPPAPQPGSGNSCKTIVGLYIIFLLLCLT
ncbi:uncharacterized protein LOC131928699 [Physella acuta]|uniref:uncharacterized protein LOC131928699 n=1 Tax=Physella acuta TaxID=109671 RepID=UPI0027DBD3AF|nr:uncharacterized protein LOC131928699 [Physella acuta]